MEKKKRKGLGINVKKLAVDTVHDALGGILYAIGVYTFAAHADFAPGGITGIAMIINHFFPFIPIGLMTLLINVPVIMLCYKVLGKGFLLRSLRSMVIGALFLDIVVPMFPNYQDNPLLAALFGGILSGAGLAIIYLSGSSTGGTDFLIMSVRKRIPHMSIGTITLAIDGAVIVAGGFVFGNINAVLYGVLMTVASTLVIDKLMYGSGARKMLLVISDESEKIAQRISNEVGRGVTLFKATGAYTGKERIVVMCFCSKREIIHMRSIVYSIDENAMVTFSTVDEAYGLGFKPFAEDQ